MDTKSIAAKIKHLVTNCKNAENELAEAETALEDFLFTIGWNALDVLANYKDQNVSEAASKFIQERKPDYLR